MELNRGELNNSENKCRFNRITRIVLAFTEEIYVEHIILSNKFANKSVLSHYF